MPLYEYECDKCGQRFEVIRKFSDPPVEQCTGCGGPVHKLLSSPAIQFKGSGWYVTDYGKGSKSPAPAKGSSDSKGSTSGSDSAGSGSTGSPGSTGAGESSGGKKSD